MRAVAGRHILLNGPPGSGKTLLARPMSAIIQPLTQGEALEVTKIYSAAGMLPIGSPLIIDRPFRSPHRTIPNAGVHDGESVFLKAWINPLGSDVPFK